MASDSSLFPSCRTHTCPASSLGSPRGALSLPPKAPSPSRWPGLTTGTGRLLLLPLSLPPVPASQSLSLQHSEASPKHANLLVPGQLQTLCDFQVGSSPPGSLARSDNLSHFSSASCGFLLPPSVTLGSSRFWASPLAAALV